MAPSGVEVTQRNWKEVIISPATFPEKGPKGEVGRE